MQYCRTIYLEQDQDAPVPRGDCNGHLVAMRVRYAVPSSGLVTGRVRAPSAVVRVSGARRQGTCDANTTGHTAAARRVTTRVITVYRVTVVNRWRLVGYDHRPARTVVFRLW